MINAEDRPRRALRMPWGANAARSGGAAPTVSRPALRRYGASGPPGFRLVDVPQPEVDGVEAGVVRCRVLENLDLMPAGAGFRRMIRERAGALPVHHLAVPSVRVWHFQSAPVA